MPRTKMTTVEIDRNKARDERRSKLGGHEIRLLLHAIKHKGFSRLHDDFLTISTAERLAKKGLIELKNNKYRLKTI